jgi:hypothetical protein
MEAATPALLLLRDRWRYAAIAWLCVFHVITWLTIRIHFLALIVCLPAFLPLERLTRIWRE